MDGYVFFYDGPQEYPCLFGAGIVVSQEYPCVLRAGIPSWVVGGGGDYWVLERG